MSCVCLIKDLTLYVTELMTFLSLSLQHHLFSSSLAKVHAPFLICVSCFPHAGMPPSYPAMRCQALCWTLPAKMPTFSLMILHDLYFFGHMQMRCLLIQQCTARRSAGPCQPGQDARFFTHALYIFGCMQVCCLLIQQRTARCPAGPCQPGQDARFFTNYLILFCLATCRYAALSSNALPGALLDPASLAKLRAFFTICIRFVFALPHADTLPSCPATPCLVPCWTLPAWPRCVLTWRPA